MVKVTCVNVVLTLFPSTALVLCHRQRSADLFMLLWNDECCSNGLKTNVYIYLYRIA